MYLLTFIHEKLDKKKIIEFFFFLWPIIIFFPSGVVNFYIIILIILSFLIIDIKKNFLIEDKIFFFFFVSLILSSFLNKNEQLNTINSYYNLTLFRFFLVYLIFRIFFSQIKIASLQFFLKIILSASVILSLDIFHQHLIGYDLLGFQSFNNRYSGFFEHEAIAGSYIYKFLIFSIISIFFTNFLKNHFTKIIALCICITGILFSFDRSPFFFSLLLLFFLLLFIKNKRNFFLTVLILIFLVFIFSFKNYLPLKERYNNSIDKFIVSSQYLLKNIILNIKNKNLFLDKVNNEENKKNFSILDGNLFDQYGNLFYSSYIVIKDKYIFGHGHKSFLVKCLEKKKEIPKLFCSNHPHNIYLEIIISGGLVSLIIFFLFIFIIFKKLIKNILLNNINIYLIIYLIIEFFPLRSFGSILSTFNGYLFFSSLGIICGLILRKKI